MIKSFYFNELRTCCYLLWDHTQECVIVDAGCYSDSEKGRLVKFIEENGLKPIKLLQTHGHFDHLIGCSFVKGKWNIPAYMSHYDRDEMNKASMYGLAFGYHINQPIDDFIDVKDGDIIRFGESCLKVIATPGHTPGGVSYYNEADGYILTGDSLFSQTIGRTDLPGGDYDVLIESLRNKILTLPGEVIVYPGHGLHTNISTEKNTNPFLV